MINGADILNEIIIYKSVPFYTHYLPIFITCVSFLIILYGAFKEKGEDMAIGAGLLLFAMIFYIIVSDTSTKTIFNYPSKIQYTVEIKHEDDAWKVIGPNYEVKEKLFENREIYVIEKDYIEENERYEQWWLQFLRTNKNFR